MNITKEEIETKLDLVRPFLQEDGGNVEFVEMSPSHVLKIKLIGSCSTCNKKENTIRLGIENVLKQFYPELKVVEV